MTVATIVAVVLGGLALLLVLFMGGLTLRFYRGRRRANRIWAEAQVARLEDLGSVKRLSVLPLIDGQTASDELAGEAGVSYLVRADDTTVLFDLGANEQAEHPSPLLRNMQALGVVLEDVDAIVISHPHFDHTGGMEQQRKHAFGLSTQPVDLTGIPAFVPAPLAHPTARVEVVEGPRAIAPGVASVGPIPRQLFLLGWTPEQALAVHVKGRGIVLISGCGHPTLERMLRRAEMLFDEPIYGVIGGLHFPVTGGGIRRLLGTGKPPWSPVSREEVAANVELLRRRQPKVVALSPHDSCAWSIQAFRQAFGEAYHDLLVGQEIVVA
jgi:7,8-dihydropterin-6-yl-methyl-4-(beta-D-ribofuranosyl)aminobenzene 5'-phosphate synthase